MSLLHDASKTDLKRLLGTFPVTALKAGWPSVKGTKEEICFAAAEERDPDKIISFMETNFARCRQHVYIFSAPEGMMGDPGAAVPDAEVLSVDGGGRSMILTTASFDIFLKDPSEEAIVEFLWPMRFEKLYNFLVFSLIILERNPCIYFDRDCFKLSRSIDERGIVKNIESLGYLRADLHRGVKTLWEENFMDSHRTNFKKPKSTAMEAMDQELGIKEHNPTLYEELQSATLFTTLFQVSPGSDCCVDEFHVDPSGGYIAFPRYTEGAGDADYVVQELLKKNS